MMRDDSCAIENKGETEDEPLSLKTSSSEHRSMRDTRRASLDLENEDDSGADENTGEAEDEPSNRPSLETSSKYHSMLIFKRVSLG